MSSALNSQESRSQANSIQSHVFANMSRSGADLTITVPDVKYLKSETEKTVTGYIEEPVVFFKEMEKAFLAYIWDVTDPDDKTGLAGKRAIDLAQAAKKSMQDAPNREQMQLRAAWWIEASKRVSIMMTANQIQPVARFVPLVTMHKDFTGPIGRNEENAQEIYATVREMGHQLDSSIVREDVGGNYTISGSGPELKDMDPLAKSIKESVKKVVKATILHFHKEEEWITASDYIAQKTLELSTTGNGTFFDSRTFEENVGEVLKYMMDDVLKQKDEDALMRATVWASAHQEAVAYLEEISEAQNIHTHKKIAFSEAMRNAIALLEFGRPDMVTPTKADAVRKLLAKVASLYDESLYKEKPRE